MTEDAAVFGVLSPPSGAPEPNELNEKPICHLARGCLAWLLNHGSLVGETREVEGIPRL